MKETFEYTKHISENETDIINIGYYLRENNNIAKNCRLNENQKTIVDELIENPSRVLTFREFGLLEMAILTSKMWDPGQRLKIFFFRFDEVPIEKVLSKARIWANHCNVTFVRTFDIHESHIRISFEADGHWSYIGKDAEQKKGVATMNFDLRWENINSEEFAGVVLHEFGHALGLIHEHQSPMAGFTWKKDYIYRELAKDYGWPEEKVNINLFDNYDNEPKKYTLLDTNSIMAYYIPKEYTEEGIEFPKNIVLSKRDIEMIGKLYPPPPNAMINS